MKRILEELKNIPKGDFEEAKDDLLRVVDMLFVTGKQPGYEFCNLLAHILMRLAEDFVSYDLVVEKAKENITQIIKENEVVVNVRSEMDKDSN